MNRRNHCISHPVHVDPLGAAGGLDFSAGTYAQDGTHGKRAATALTRGAAFPVASFRPSLTKPPTSTTANNEMYKNGGQDPRSPAAGASYTGSCERKG